MPGRAAKPTAQGDGTPAPPLAPVVSLARRRRGRPNRVPPQASPDEQVAAWWRNRLMHEGLDFDSSTTPAEMMRVLSPILDGLVDGLLYLRYGGGPHDVAPDPEAGIDYKSSKEIRGLLRDMAAAAAVHRDAVGGSE